jgi:hypothetical protein
VAGTDFDRILFVLDACCDVSDGSLERVVSMAARLHAALEGLFVEDAQLLRAAQLPFATEIGGAGRERALRPDAVRHANQIASARIAHRLQHTAASRNVRWNMTLAAGSRLAAALEAAQHADLLLAARAARRPGALHAGSDYRRVCLLLDAASPVQRALDVVRALAANGHTRDVTVLGAHAPPPQLLAQLRAAGLRTFAQIAPAGNTGALLREAGARGTGLLIAPRSLLLSVPPSPADVRILEALTVPLLLLR